MKLNQHKIAYGWRWIAIDEAWILFSRRSSI